MTHQSNLTARDTCDLNKLLSQRIRFCWRQIDLGRDADGYYRQESDRLYSLRTKIHG